MPKSKQQKREEALARQRASAAKDIPLIEALFAEQLRDHQASGSRFSSERLEVLRCELNRARGRAGLPPIMSTIDVLAGGKWRMHESVC